MKEVAEGSAGSFFRPEFLNRVDDIIVFRSLNRADMKHIIDIELRRSQAAQGKEPACLSPTKPRNCSSRRVTVEFGARPLRRAIEHLLEDPLSEDILRGSFHGFDIIKAELVAGEAPRRRSSSCRARRKQ